MRWEVRCDLLDVGYCWPAAWHAVQQVYGADTFRRPPPGDTKSAKTFVVEALVSCRFARVSSPTSSPASTSTVTYLRGPMRRARGFSLLVICMQCAPCAPPWMFPSRDVPLQLHDGVDLPYLQRGSDKGSDKEPVVLAGNRFNINRVAQGMHDMCVLAAHPHLQPA